MAARGAMRAWSLPVVFAVLCVTLAARAEPDPAKPPRLSVRAGGHAMAALGGNVCRQSSSDTVECGGGLAFAGLQLSPSYRVSPLLSLGLIGSLGWRTSQRGTASSGGTSTDFDQRMWRLTAEATLHPFSPGVADPWFGLEAGVVSIRDSLTYHGVPGRSMNAASQIAPCAALAFGTDWFVTSHLGLGIDARLMLLGFGKNPPDLVAPWEKATSYGVLVGVWLGANVTWRM